VEAVAGGMAPTTGLVEGVAGEAAEAAAFSGPQGANIKSCITVYTVRKIFLRFVTVVIFLIINSKIKKYVV
jgi:hypothetical protein